MRLHADNMINLHLKGYDDIIQRNRQEVKLRECFSDVTLACEDKEIQVHKIIICLASPVLQNILKLNLNQNSLLYFTETKYTDLENIIKYIYLGEVNIGEKDLESFLGLAEDLDIDFSKENIKSQLKNYLEISKETNDSFRNNIKSCVKNNFINEPLAELGEENSKYQIKNGLEYSNKKNDSFRNNIKSHVQNEITDEYQPKLKKDLNLNDNFINEPQPELYEDSHLNNRIFDYQEDLDMELLKENNGFMSDTNSPTKINFINTSSPILEQHANLKSEEYKPVKEEHIFSVACLVEDEIKIENIEPLQQKESFQNNKQEKLENTSVTRDKNISSNKRIKLSKNKCIFCGYETYGKVLLNRHIRKNHEANIASVCYLCRKSFTSKAHMKRHIMTVHMNQKRFKCEHCDYSCNDNSDLKRHLNSKHSKDEDKIENKVHLKKTKNKKITEKSLDKIRLFQCDVCDKRFANKSKLLRHKRKHYRGGYLECEICTRDCRDSFDLKKHMKTHLKIKKFRCDMCDYSGIDKPDLENHKQDINHTSREIFQCENCNKKLKNKASLQSHLKLHDPSSCIQCDMCNKRFPNKSKLNRHRNSHFGGGNLKCEKCEQTFRDMHDYKKHKPTHLKIKPITIRVPVD